jgi:hypothetical protein
VVLDALTKNPRRTQMMNPVWNREAPLTALGGVSGALRVQGGNSAGAQCQAPDAHGHAETTRTSTPKCRSHSQG